METLCCCPMPVLQSGELSIQVPLRGGGRGGRTGRRLIERPQGRSAGGGGRGRGASLASPGSSTGFELLVVARCSVRCLRRIAIVGRRGATIGCSRLDF
eukprot:SAG31_NODE_1489_length_8135_cov_3.382558_2_plen_99_part_00